LPPDELLDALFKQANRNKSPIPIFGILNGYKFNQTLVKFRSKWRLYINTEMRKNSGLLIGDLPNIELDYDPEERKYQIHPGLMKALNENQDAKMAFDSLTPSRQREILRYINSLKNEITIENNITKAINHLINKERFVGR
jgi:hypothetical protein